MSESTTSYQRTLFLPLALGPYTTLRFPNKDPGETLDYTLDITEWLNDAAGDSVLIWTLQSLSQSVTPLTITYTGTGANLTPQLTAEIGAGFNTQVYPLLYTVTTAQGRVLSRTIWLTVLQITPEYQFGAPMFALPPSPGSNTEGTMIYSGTVAPPNTLGQNGDYYFQVGTGSPASLLYIGPKAAGAWPDASLQLAGPAGAAGSPGTNGASGQRGSLWWNGTGNPGAIVGAQNGDYYLDVAAANVWELESGAWVDIGNIKGIPGSSTSITNASLTTEMALSDFVGASTGGLDHKIALSDLLNAGSSVIATTATAAATPLVETETARATTQETTLSGRISNLAAVQGALSPDAVYIGKILYRSSTANYVTSTRDSSGKVGEYLTSDGTKFVSQLKMGDPLNPSRSSIARGQLVRSSADQQIIGLESDGYLQFVGFSLVLPPALYRTSDTAHYQRLTSSNGKVLSGYEVDGSYTFVPSPFTLESIDRLGYIYPSTFGTAYNYSNVRHGPVKATLVATGQESNGASYEVMINSNGNKTPFLAATSTMAELQVFSQIGQSNAGAGGSYVSNGPWSGASPFPFHIVTGEPYGQIYSSAPHNGNLTTDWVALSQVQPNGMNGPFYSLNAQCFAIEQFMRDEGQVSTGRYARTVWWGGEPIDVFLKSANQAYQVLIAEMQSIARIAPSYNRTPVCVAMNWVQGENVSSVYPGPTAYANALLTGIIAPFNADIATIFPNANSGVTPLWLIAQISTTMTTNTYGAGEQAQDANAIGQLQVAQGGGQYTTMSGPMYFTPLEIGQPHAIEIGRIMAGEVQADAWMNWKAAKDATGTGTWNPLWPTGAVISGTNQIVITFELPPNGGPIEWDTDWIGSPTPIIPGASLGSTPNYGFTYSDSLGNTISSVAITASNQITLTLSGNITSATARTYGYAINNPYPTQTGSVCFWAGVRGQLRSPTTRESAGYRAGYTIPQFVKHYSVRFQGTL